MSEVLKKLAGDTVEALCGAALIVCGIIVQVSSSPEGEEPNRTLMITGGILVAFGGVLLSWITSKALSEQHALDAAVVARDEVDQKLDNLSRVLGQSAGQISQAVEQAELEQIPASTGFALVSQATRMIYGQVNEIAVIRGSEFDSAYLLQTASQLDALARQLGAPGNGGHTDDIAEVRRQLEAVQASLSATAGASQKTFGSAAVPCPNCNTTNNVRLGTTPGETAAATCKSCGETFNSHRAANGTAFSRPRRTWTDSSGARTLAAPPQQVDKWEFECPSCGSRMRTLSGAPARLMACTNCFDALSVDASQQLVNVVGKFRLVENPPYERNGNRPKFECPDCGRPVRAALRVDKGYLGICVEDKVALVLQTTLYDLAAEPAS